MEKVKQSTITFEGKRFKFLTYFWGDMIYSCGNARLIVNPDGSIYGAYQMDRKGFRVIL